MLPRAENAIPHASEGRESKITRLMTFVMPIMVMWHLGKRKPTLGLVRKIQIATDT